MRLNPFSLTLIAAALVLAGCGRDQEQPKAKVVAPPPPLTTGASTAEQAPPLRFQQKSTAVDVALTLPAELAREPELHRRLYDREVKELKDFAESAKAEYAEMGGPDGGAGSQPSEKKEDWSVAAQTSKLLSLRSLTYEFDSGGAHPNIVYSALLWDKSLKSPVELAALFKPKADFAPVEAALCEGLKAERRQHFGVEASTPAPCPKIAATPFQLAPSSEPGKAGGLTFLIAPYALGALSDGPYQVTVPLSTFAGNLAPAYADEFAGKPAAGLQRGAK